MSNHLAFERLKGRENFSEWKTGARAYLTSEGLWSEMTKTLTTAATVAEKAQNDKALAELILLLEPSLYSYVEEISEAKAALEINEDKGAVRKVTLLKQWISLKSNECNSIHEYVNKCVALRAKVRTMWAE